MMINYKLKLFYEPQYEQNINQDTVFSDARITSAEDLTVEITSARRSSDPEKEKKGRKLLKGEKI